MRLRIQTFIFCFLFTLKGHPTYPGRFETFEATQSYCLSFFPWYNHRHLHSAIGFVTPADKHFGKKEDFFIQSLSKHFTK